MATEISENTAASETGSSGSGRSETAAPGELGPAQPVAGQSAGNLPPAADAQARQAGQALHGAGVEQANTDQTAAPAQTEQPVAGQSAESLPPAADAQARQAGQALKDAGAEQEDSTS